jgi:hypothetical protein
MKKILLFILVFASFRSIAQVPILLDTVNNACHVDKIGFAKDNMTYTLNGDSSINLVIVGAASYVNSHYSRFRDPVGSPFANRTALTNWLDLYFFANALADTTSGGGGDTATLTSVTTGAGNNLTPNAIQINGFANLDLTKSGTALLEQGANGGVYRIDSAAGTIVGAVEITNTSIGLSAVSSSITIRPQTGSDAAILSSGRIQAQEGINTNDVATMSQLLLLGETSSTAYRGDRGVLAYNHSQLTGGTNPHNTTYANIASKPTTVVGYGITDAAILGGNTLGAEPVIGSTDNFALSFKVNNSVVAKVVSSGIISGGGVQNLASAASARVLTQSTGVLIDRNVNDANSLAKFNYINTSGTGLTIDCQKNGVTNLSVSNTGTATATKFAVSALNTAPASATDTGTTGEVRITSGFIYVCTTTNVWVRAALITF